MVKSDSTMCRISGICRAQSLFSFKYLLKVFPESNDTNPKSDSFKLFRLPVLSSSDMRGNRDSPKNYSELEEIVLGRDPKGKTLIFSFFSGRAIPTAC